VLFFGFLVPVVGLVVLPRRVRRGPGAEARTQARLLFSTLVGGFAVAAVLGVVTVLLDTLSEAPSLTLVDPTAHGPGSSGEPIALLFWFSRLASAAVAVVMLVATRRDRLWTAERWFSRGLAVLLAMAVGGGTFVVLRTVSADTLGPTVATAVATGVVALGLGSLYVRAERLVDRLLYGTRPAPYRVLADVTALSHSTASATGGAAPDLARIAEAVALGLGAAVCRLTVRRPGLRDRTYEWVDRGVRTTAADLVEVPVRHGNEEVAVLAVDRHAVSGLNAQRDHLLTDVADALGVVVEASRSGIELERQLRAAIAHAEEIAVSRRRAVAEMDSERRRIERDLHDGAQHHLVSLRLTLGLVEHQVATGELAPAREWLEKLAGQLADAEAVLAATVDGVSSLVLAEHGLVAALRAELGAAHPPVAFDDGGIPVGRRFPAEVEAAVWFCCAEAVGNARKHAAGAPVTVELAERGGALHFAVRDEGPGFRADAEAAPAGRGLRNMTARVSTVSGTVAIRSTPGVGTAVEGSVPLPADADPAPEIVPAPEVEAPAPVATPASRRGRLAGQVRDLVRRAAEAYGDAPERGRVAELGRRLDEPVRIAVLSTVDDGRRMLVEALVGTPDVPRPETAAPVPVRYAYGAEGVEPGPEAEVVTLPAPALRAMTLVDVRLPAESGGGCAVDHVRGLLAAPGVADAIVLLLHYGRPADVALLELLHEVGQRGAVGVLARADGSGAAADEAVAEYGLDPAVRRVCEAVVSVAPATAVAAARLGDAEFRMLQGHARDPDGKEPPAGSPLLDRLGSPGVRRALALVRSGAARTRTQLAAALVRHSGLAELQELVAARFVRRADALRTRSVLAGLDALLRTCPPAGDAAQELHYQLERIRAGAHELREIELLDVLRSGDLPLPDDELRAAERLLGADGADVRARLGLSADATVEQLRAEAARQPARWRELAAHPVTSTRVREAAQVLVRTCEELAVQVDDPAAAREGVR
jgi:signal transduction histidine kinase